MKHLPSPTCYRVALLCVLVYCLSGCKKSDGSPQDNFPPIAVDSSRGSLVDYYAFTSQPSNGNFGLKSYATQADQSDPRISFAGGAFTDGNMNGIAGGPVVIGNLIFHDSLVGSDYNYNHPVSQGASLYGSVVKFYINPNSDGLVTGRCAQASLYVPTFINIISPSVSSNIKTGSGLTWNPDPLNTKQVLITLQYGNLINSVMTGDNGNYHFRTQDFAGFPISCSVKVTLVRMNYAMASSLDSTRKYQISAYNAVSGEFGFGG